MELKWAPDSLLLDLNQIDPQTIVDSSSITNSEGKEQKNEKDIKIREDVTLESKPAISESKKINEEKKESIAFTEPKAITLEQAYKLYNRDVKFVDARDEADYLTGHIANSINIPFDDFDNHKQKLELLSKEKPLVIYCAGTDCDLSHMLANLLFEQGYKQVYVFFGGWLEWLNAKYPVENSSE